MNPTPLHILIVKTSSMGDVIHTLPAVTDLRSAYPDATIDWLVESAFAEIPQQHPAISDVITMEWRHWVKTKNLKAIWAFLKRLSCKHYDIIIDAQGLFKSALFSTCVKGHRHGFDGHSAREPLARLFYHTAHRIPKQQHAVERTRQLFAQALGYPYSAEALDYGLANPPLTYSTRFPMTPSKSTLDLVFLVNTTWDSKHWPDLFWTALIQRATAHGYTIHLTSGSPTEWRHIQTITQGLSGVILYPRQSIRSVMTLLRDAAAVVTVDTGFGHLAAALDKPTIALFGPTDPARSKPYSPSTRALAPDVTQYACSPCLKRTCTHAEFAAQGYPPCYREISPEYVWQALQNQIILY